MIENRFLFLLDPLYVFSMVLTNPNRSVGQKERYWKFGMATRHIGESFFISDKEGEFGLEWVLDQQFRKVNRCRILENASFEHTCFNFPLISFTVLLLRFDRAKWTTFLFFLFFCVSIFPPTCYVIYYLSLFSSKNSFDIQITAL